MKKLIEIPLLCLKTEYDSISHPVVKTTLHSTQDGEIWPNCFWYTYSECP